MSWVNYCQVTIGGCELIAEQSVLIDVKTEQSVPLTNQACQLLCRLAVSANQAVERDELIELLWCERYQTGSKGLTNLIWQLRKGFEQLHANCQIEVNRGPQSCYTLIADVAIKWRYAGNSNVADHNACVTFDLAQSKLIDENGQPLSIALSPQQVDILASVANLPNRTVNLYTLAHQLERPESDILSDVLTIQQRLTQYDSKAYWFSQFDGHDFSFIKPVKPKANQQSQMNHVIATNHKDYVNALARKLKYSQIVIVILVFILGWLIITTTPDKPVKPMSQPTHVDLGSKILRHIGLYHHFDRPIEPQELLDIAEQEFTAQKSTNRPLEQIEIEYLLTLTEGNLVMSRYDKAQYLLNKVAMAIEQLTPNTAFSQQIKLQFYTMQIWLKVDTGQQAQAKAFLQLAESTPIDKITDKKVFWSLNITRFSLYLQLGMFETLILQAETLIPELSQHSDRDTSILRIWFYDRYSTALRQLGENKRAIIALEKAAALENEIFTVNRASRASRISRLAVINTMEGQYQQGIELFQQAIAIYEQLAEVNYYSIALVKSNFSSALLEIDSVTEALNQIDESIKLAELNIDDSGGLLGYFKLIKANHLYNLADLTQASNLLNQAAPIIESKTGQNHPAQGRLLLLKAQLSREAGDIVGCNGFAQLAADKFTAIYQKPKHWEQQLANMVKVSCQLIDSQAGDSHYDQAIKQIKQTLKALKTQMGDKALPVRKYQRALGLGID